MITKKDIELAHELGSQRIVKELVESCDLLLKGNRMLTENNLSQSEYDVLQEGAWESIKYGLAKLGRYKAGGKIFGKGKIDQEAGAKIQSILDKKGNEVIKKLDDAIKKTNPEFPNNKSGEEFLNTVEAIAAVYDELKIAVKKEIDEKGSVDINTANSIIKDLAEYVKKFLDVDLAAAYTVMDSEEDKVKDGKEELLTDDVEDVNEDRHSDVRGKLQAKAGDEKYDTKRMGKEGLASNRLPLLLTSIGSSLGAFSWLVNTEWFKHLFEEVYQYTDVEKIKSVIETKTEILHNIKPNEGVYKFVGGATNHTLNANSSPEEMIDAFKQIGGGDANKGVDLLCQKGGVMMNPEGASKGLHDLVNNPDKYKNLGELFNGEASGTGKLVDPHTGLNTTLYGTIAGKSMTSLLVEKLPVIIIKTVTKTGVKMGAGYAVAKGFASVLGPIGIGMLTAGALVKLMRMKGLKQSRAKTLNDLLQSLQPIPDSEATTKQVIQLKPNPIDSKDEDPNKENPKQSGEPPKPQDFLQGNRNMQLAYLSELFLPQGKSLWDQLGVKRGTVIPSGFLDAALGQGKQDQKKYLSAYYKHLKKENSFTSNISADDWVKKVNSGETLALIKWIRNTRKSIGSFIKSIKNKFPNFGIGERAQAKSTRPGERGKAMGLVGDSILGSTDDLLTEGGLDSLKSVGFDNKKFMKNLPQFMEMLSAMYYSVKSDKLPYNKQEVLKSCKKFGCKQYKGSGYKKTKSKDYKVKGTDYMLDSTISEEVNRIKKLMK